jgi:hypothetical protein
MLVLIHKASFDLEVVKATVHGTVRFFIGLDAD